MKKRVLCAAGIIAAAAAISAGCSSGGSSTAEQTTQAAGQESQKDTEAASEGTGTEVDPNVKCTLTLATWIWKDVSRNCIRMWNWILRSSMQSRNTLIP